MATPPFLPDETKPADADVVSQYPAVERLFRDIVESWLLIEHDTDGEHKLVSMLEQASDPAAATNTGKVYTKDDAGDTELFYRDDSGAVLQITEDGGLKGVTGVLHAPATTSMFLYQNLAPAGWSKDIAATLGNHALVLATDVAWSGGTKGATPFTTVFGASKTAGGTILSTGQIPAHTHGLGAGGVVRGFTGALAAAAGNDRAILNDTETNTGGGGSHNHTLSLDLNHIQMIRITKD